MASDIEKTLFLNFYSSKLDLPVSFFPNLAKLYRVMMNSRNHQAILYSNAHCCQIKENIFF